MGNWYIEEGPQSDVVMSSRVRLARNLKKYPFPYKMTPEQQMDVIKDIKAILLKSRSTFGTDLVFVDMAALPGIERQSLVEKRLISPDFATSQSISGLAVNKNESISIMINEEDHLRIQCLFAGMQMEKAWELCSRIDQQLEEEIEYAFDKEMGYLTCCPTNVGTGIRASVMLHLPALTMTGYINGVLEGCGKLGIAVRGIYGENTEASGNMYQISNQITLGLSEEEIISNIAGIVNQIISQERNIRSELLKQSEVRFDDRVFRSCGLLKNARIMSSEECIKLLSDVKLGVDMGIIKNIGSDTINELMIFTQSANLQKIVGKPLGPDERDVERAAFIRKKLES